MGTIPKKSTMPRKTDPQSVKDALTGRDILDLKTSIDTLGQTMAEGFKGVHERQDTTNGKVLKARDDIIENKTQTDKEISELKSEFKYNRIIWYLFTVAVSVIIALGSYIILKH
jgi:hypothetical protein